MNLSKYSKFLVALLGAVVNVIAVQYSSNHYVVLAVAVLTALGVYTVPNRAV